MFRRVYGYARRLASGAIDFLAECRAVVGGVFVMPLRCVSDQRRAMELDRLPDALLRDIGVKRDRT